MHVVGRWNVKECPVNAMDPSKNAPGILHFVKEKEKKPNKIPRDSKQKRYVL